MRTLLVGYDLNSPGQNYEALTDEIKGLGPWWHHLDSTWLVRTDRDHTTVRDLLKVHLDSGDELLVIDVTRRARAWYGFSDRAGAWLKNTFVGE